MTTPHHAMLGPHCPRRAAGSHPYSPVGWFQEAEYTSGRQRASYAAHTHQQRNHTMTKFIADTDHLMKSRSTVARNYPAAVVIARVAGGWMLFPSRNEWRAWNRQK